MPDTMRSRARLLQLATACLALSGCFPPEWGANAILMPSRRPVTGVPPLAYEKVDFTSDGVTLSGWLFRTEVKPRRGLIVYLHGIADNKQSSIGIAQRYVPQGYDVLGYDSRAHGASGGEFCTYGYYEKGDLSRGLDAVHAERAILFGSSLGASVALQAAAVEPRVKGVIAQSPYADLPSIVRERAPFFATKGEVREALVLAGRKAGFDCAEASAERAAARIQVPVLLLHGARDRETSPAHSRRIAAALVGPHQLMVVEGAGHNDVLARADVWRAIDEWLAALAVDGP